MTTRKKRKISTEPNKRSNFVQLLKKRRSNHRSKKNRQSSKKRHTSKKMHSSKKKKHFFEKEETFIEEEDDECNQERKDATYPAPKKSHWSYSRRNYVDRSYKEFGSEGP
ncbi:hypothetical protein M0812_07234 [Anaeramoeba flamelloides]|uniref:Uncharacterized protein n=1 Tax=Anaeramoeba flamelloides TaxID=1746091 RepID=A0AAV8AEB2_9EUKA|nr:hypothetical protein M0812_07234 [Anaeramoeba flamelloides]